MTLEKLQSMMRRVRQVAAFVKLSGLAELPANAIPLRRAA